MKTNRSSILNVTLTTMILAAAASLMFSQNATAPAQKAPARPKAPERPGSMERIVVHGKSLEGNLEGDSPDRNVIVYTPVSYAQDRNRRYPVLYFLHGYTAHAETYTDQHLWASDGADKAIAAGTSKEVIIVFPDSFTKYEGSMYSNSPVTGDWETYITQDLVQYIDSHYRTIATRESRGLAGHSMGGYGAIRIGMKHPETYAAMYPMSACCLMNNPFTAAPGPAPAANDKGKTKGGGGFPFIAQAQAAAWAPNPLNPPDFFDLPTKDGQVNPAVAAKYLANSPLAMLDQYVPNLKKYRGIMLDCGLQDSLQASNKELDESLTRLGIQHSYETYEGNHINRLKERWQQGMMPFFAKNLAFTAAKK